VDEARAACRSAMPGRWWRSRTRRWRGAEQSGGTNAAAKGPVWWLCGAEKQEGTGAVASAREKEGEGEAAAVLGAAGPGRGPVGAAAGAARAGGEGEERGSVGAEVQDL
jgi:hypothetical protein